MDSSYSNCDDEFEEEIEGEEEDNQIEDDDEDENVEEESDEEEEDDYDDDNDFEYGVTEKSDATNGYNVNEVQSSENGSASSGTLGLYSSFDSMIGGNLNANSDQSSNVNDPKVDEHLISSHLKGTLSFGLPKKGNTLRIHKPYRLLKKKSLFHQPKKSSQSPKTLVSVIHRTGNSSKSDLKNKIEKEAVWDNIEHLDENLKIAYRIVKELMGDSLKAYNTVFMETIEMDPTINGDYLEVVKKPIWLPKIKENLLKGEYKTITEVISQLRLMLENTYKYFGANHSFARRGIKLEFILEQKLSLLRKDVRELCTLEMTHNITEKDMKEAKRTKGCCITFNSERYFSYLLYKERGCRHAREKELKKKRLDHMRQAKILKENEILQWDANLTEGPLGGPIGHMWELVQINQFVFLSMKVLNISQISQYEMERIFMIPEASITLRMLMTSLVSSPLQRLKLSEKPYMPYNVWARRLANKTFHWYRVYSRESHNSLKLFDQLGIEPKFWSVCGDKNPFSKKLFHEMSLYQRVWLVKSLCDYIAHTHKSVQEAISEQPEDNMREILLGKDSDGNEYIYFPHLNGTDLRVYRRTRERHQNIFNEEEEKGNENKQKLFSKDRVKAFKKLIKKLKRNREKDEDWYYEQRKLKNRLPKKRGRKPLLTSSHLSTPPEKRSRPEHLRQTPKPRYDLLAIESCLDDGDDDLMIPRITGRKSSKRKAYSDSESDEDEEEEEEKEESNKDQEDGENKDQNDQKTEEIKENVKEKTSRKKNSKSVCKTCGKTFRSKSAMYGHTAMHVKKKDKNLDSEINDKDEDMELPSGEKRDLENVNEDNEKDNKEGTINLKNLKTDLELEEKDIKLLSFPENKEEIPVFNGNSTLKEEVCDLNSVVKKEDNDDGELKIPLLSCENKNDEMFKENIVDRDLISSSSNSSGNCNKNAEGVDGDNLNSIEKRSRSSSPDDDDDDDAGNNLSSGGTSTPAEPDLKNLAAEPDKDNFELVAASFVELRNLILKFGTLPPKYKREKKSVDKENEDEEDEEEKEVEEEEEDRDENEIGDDKANIIEEEPKRPKCEQKLHKALCKLLQQLGPSELKLNSFHKQLRKKIWSEYLDWHGRDSTYIDPAEEAWKSDPEPEPTPSATQTPKPSSSSSSSEESYNDDGTRKRKLRKRRAKRSMPPDPPPSPPSVPNSRATSPANPLTEESIAVSSRGRVRKVKKIVNYDRLDFDKLAQEAEEEAEKQKEKKKKKKEGDTSREKALQEAAQSLHIPSSGVRRYIISKEGEVVGYIGNDGQVHSGYVKPKEQDTKSSLVDHQKQENVAASNKIRWKPSQEARNKIPKVVVSAVNHAGTLVYVRMVGNQALEMMKLIESSKNNEPRQIKLQRFSQNFTFYTNSYILTENIPGYPDYDTSDPKVLEKLSSPSISKNLSPAVKASPKKTTLLPSTPISSSEVPISKPPNPVALAYQGVSVSTSCERDPIKSPVGTSCASLSASTRLVFASPSAVPSVPPITATSGIRLPTSSSAPSPLLVQTENGQQLQVGLTSERLSQIVQKTGQRIVAVPNDKGGYTLSLIPSVNSQTNSNFKMNKNTTSCGPGIQGSPQKSVVTQLLPTAVSGGSVTTHQPVSIIKSKLPRSLNTPVSSQQQMVPNCTVSSQIVNPPPVGRQVIFQHPNINSSQKVVSSITQPQQFLQITQSPLVQQQQQQQHQQQFFHIQQPSQKIVQLVHTSGNQRVVQMIQPGQVLVSNNGINSSVSAIQQPSGAVVLQTPQGIKQASVLQPQVVVQSPQQTKILQVTNPDQYSQQIQYDQSQVQPQQIIIQPQQYFIQQPQEVLQQSQLNTSLVTNAPHLEAIKQEDSIVTNAPLLEAIKQEDSISIKEEPILKQEALTDTPVEPRQQYLIQASLPQPASSINVVRSTQSQLNTNTTEQPLTQPFTLITKKTNQTKEQISTFPSNTPTKDNNTKASTRVVLLLVNGVQKAFLQLPDGRMSMLSSDQLQPLLASGAIKLSS